MKNISIIIVSAIMLSLGCGSNGTTTFQKEFHKDTTLSASDSTSIEWLDGTLVELGQIKRGPTVDIEFPFKNIGDKPLIFSNIQVTCGCTLFKIPKEPVMPGKKGKFTVQFVSSEQALAHHLKHIYITSNIKGSPNLSLAFKVELTE